MIQYFIHDGQNEKGPFDLEQLKREKLVKDTPIWYEGLEKWTTAGEVEELKVLFITTPTPPPLKPTVIPTLKTSAPLTSANNNAGVSASKKKSLMIIIVPIVIIVAVLIGWLIYQNKTQADNLSNVQQQIIQQQQDQLQKEQQQALQQQQEQA